jgi:hypothetical protein
MTVTMHNKMKIVMSMFNIVMISLLMIVYTTRLDSTPTRNCNLYTSRHDFRPLVRDYRDVNQSLHEGGCYDHLDEYSFQVPGYSTDVVSPTCQCLVSNFTRIFFNRSTEQSLLSLVSGIQPSSDFSQFVNTIAQLGGYDQTQTALADFVSEAHAIKLMNYSNFLDGTNNSNAVQEHRDIVMRCMWSHPLTRIQPTQLWSNLAVLASMYGLCLLGPSLLELQTNLLTADKLTGQVFFTLWLVIYYVWHVVLTAYTLNPASIAVVSMVSLIPVVLALWGLFSSTAVHAGKYLMYGSMIPILMLLYNITHYHLDVIYNIVSIMLVIVILLVVASSITFYKTGTTPDSINLDKGLFSVCCVALIGTLYSIIPPDDILSTMTHTMRVTPWVLCIYLFFPPLVSFSELWAHKTTMRFFFYIDFILSKAILVACIVDILQMNKPTEWT